MRNLVYNFMFLFMSVTIFAQDESIELTNEIVYFSEYVEKAYHTIPEIQLNKLATLENQAKWIQSQQHLEWMWDLRSGIFQENEFSGNLEAPFLFQNGWELNSSLQKTFFSIGGRMNLDFTFRAFTAETIGANPEKGFFLVPSITLQYVQPLLKNAFGVLDRLPSTLTSLEGKISEWTKEEENAYILANYKKLYMQWSVYDKIIDFLQTSLKNAKELHDNALKQMKIGYIDAVDYQNAKLLMFRIENDLLDANQAYTNFYMQVANIVGKTNIKPDSEEWIVLEEAIENESFQGIAFEETRQSIILEFMKEKIKHTAGAVANLKLPELNVLLSASIDVYSTNTSLTAVNNRTNYLVLPAFYAGLQLKYPFGDITYKHKSLELQKYRQEFEIVSHKYQNDFTRSQSSKQRNLEYFRDKIKNFEAINNAYEQRYNGQYRNFRQGRETLASLIDTRNAMLQNYTALADSQLRLIFEYFDYLVLNNKDEVSLRMY